MSIEKRRGLGEGLDGGDDSTFNYGTRSRVNSASDRPVQGRRRAKAPQSINGIHRRRRRKMSW